LEDARRKIVDAMGRQGKVFIRIYPQNRAMRVADSRAGFGKGKFDYWVASLRPDTMIFEVDVESEELARTALKAGSQKLPIKVKFRMDEDGPKMYELKG